MHYDYTQAACDHAVSSLLSQDNKNYFSMEYLNKTPNTVRSCAQCAIEFGVAYKVKSSSPVWACLNAVKTHHLCVYALCNNCSVTERAKAGTPPKRVRATKRKQQED